MDLKNYLKGKPHFFIVLGLTLILSSCSSTRDFNSNSEITDVAQNVDFKYFFETKAKAYETSLNYDNLYFTDLNTYRANYFTGKALFGQYQSIGQGNRFNNITIDNYGVNIYPNFELNDLGRMNWAWTSTQLESWGWVNKGWYTSWNQKGWRSNSNSWNGPIWNYWGYTLDSRTFLIIEQNRLQHRYALEKRTNERFGNRHSVYQNNTNNKVLRRQKTRSRPNTKTQSIKPYSYTLTNLSYTRSRSNSNSSSEETLTKLYNTASNSIRNSTNSGSNSNQINSSKKTLKN